MDTKNGKRTFGPNAILYDGPIDVGMDIYIAGFPLGDPEYTLTKGIISKAKASGDTSWASVDSVLEYDAESNPGNSGGPVVTADGEVVAVHYAGDSSADQEFGISRDVAGDVVEQTSARVKMSTRSASMARLSLQTMDHSPAFGFHRFNQALQPIMPVCFPGITSPCWKTWPSLRMGRCLNTAMCCAATNQKIRSPSRCCVRQTTNGSKGN